MPISKDEFRSIDEDGPPLPDLAPDTTQGAVYGFLFEHADQAFRQREIVDAVDVSEGSVGPTLKRLEEHGLVEHRDRFWTIADAEHAVASAGLHGATTADELGGGFSDDDVEAWMETAVDPIESETVQADEESIAVAFSTQSHHAGSFAVPSDAWIRGEPGQQSFVLQPVACAKLSGVWCPDMDVSNQICRLNLQYYLVFSPNFESVQRAILPWTIATLKDDLHVVGRQGSVTDEFTEQVTAATISYLDDSDAAETE